MTELEWLGCVDTERMVAFLRDRGMVSDRQLRLFAAACSRSVWQLLPDDLSRHAVQTAELLADGQATPEEQLAVFLAIDPKANTLHGIFVCGGSDGPGSNFAAMAAAATVAPRPQFTVRMGPRGLGLATYTPWECVAMALGQQAKLDARESAGRSGTKLSILKRRNQTTHGMKGQRTLVTLPGIVVARQPGQTTASSCGRSSAIHSAQSLSNLPGTTVLSCTWPRPPTSSVTSPAAPCRPIDSPSWQTLSKTPAARTSSS